MNWLAAIINTLLDGLTPELRKVICEALKQWEQTAAQTASPWDDIFCKLVKGLFQC